MVVNRPDQRKVARTYPPLVACACLLFREFLKDYVVSERRVQAGGKRVVLRMTIGIHAFR